MADEVGKTDPRKARRIVRHWTTACFTALILGCAPAAYAQEFAQVVVFGDSLSDSGNAFVLRGVANTPPDYDLDPLLVPGAPYARGGHHFQNGATWVEQLAGSLGVAGSANPAFTGNGAVASNYAVGGARARADGINVNLPDQLDAYLLHTGGVASPDALYVIAVGGNDVRDALVAYSRGQNGGAILGAALGSIATAVTRLSAAGARSILLWNAPNIGLTPALRTAGAAVAASATAISSAFNGNLGAIVGQLSRIHPGVDLTVFDAFALLTSIVANPAAYDMENVTSACVTFEAPFACRAPDTFLFWDGIHPTRATHGIIAKQVAALLQ